MTDEQDRLQDLNIEEAVGRTTPPDLSARILQAANRPLDDAITPISGANSVPHNVRPKGRRMTAAVPRRNWQGAGIAAAFMLVLAIALIAFMIVKSPSLNQPTTAGQPEPTQPANQSPLRERRDEPPKSNQSPEPQPKPDANTQSPPRERQVNEGDDGNTVDPQPGPKPDESIEQPTPEPKPDDTGEEPAPEPKPDDTIEQPRPEPKPDDTVDQPKPDDKTEVKPEDTPVAVAFIPNDRYSRGVSHYQYRKSPEAEWKSFGLPRDENGNTWLYEGWQLKSESGDIYLANGALLQLEGVVRFHVHDESYRVELVDDDLYIDCVAAPNSVFVSHEGLEVEVSNGAAVFELSSSKLSIFCVDKQVSADGKVILAGQTATLSDRGLSTIKEATKRDWNHPFLTGAPARLLSIQEFEAAPAGKMISGQLDSRTATQLDADKDGHVAVDTGRNAAVGFGLDGGHTTLRGEMVRVRYRATGAEKLVLQLFCPDRNDNFGIDLTPGKEGEWHILEIKFSDLRDRETHKDAPAPGISLSSFTLALQGKQDAQLEVDWVEFVREARFEE